MNTQGQEAPYFCLITNYNARWFVWIRYWRQVQARAVIHSACNASEKSMRYYTRQKGDNNIIYIQPASQLRLQRKKNLAMQYSTSQMVNWRFWSRLFTMVVGCTCIQQGLEGLHHNAHVWSKISFILHAQCSNCCKLFEGYKETNKHFKFNDKCE